MQLAFKNWRTTLAGLGAVSLGLGHLLTHLAAGDTSTLATDLPAIIAGVGLLFGEDAAVPKN